MFLLPTMSALFGFVLLRPHEAFEALKPLSFNFFALAVIVGYALDVRLGLTSLRTSPLFGLGLAFFTLCAISIGMKAGERVGFLMPGVGASAIGFLSVSQGVRTFRGMGVAAAVLLAITLFLAGFGVQQGLSPTQCFVSERGVVGGADVTDGRPCVVREECLEGGIPGNDYICEHAGLLRTHSIGGRVRYLGLLKDPNELSWAVGMGAPMAFALYEMRKSIARLLILLVTLGLGAVCVVMTQSRSGQLTFAAMMGVYFVRRFGWKGAVAAGLAGAPVLMLGGRSGDEASESTEERLGCWSEGLSMWHGNPLFGVGNGQFTEHHFLTAHSSIVLTLAEMGPLGLLLWTCVVYFAFKITIRVQMEFSKRPEAAAARTWSLAILASLTGMLVSAAFLSIPYHTLMWIYLGLAGALYASVCTHEPTFRVRFGWKDLAAVIGTDVAVIAFITVYVRHKLNGGG